jgi:serine/threonine protein kinase
MDKAKAAASRLQAAEQILEGLQHLHSHGLVHLDLKPPNVMLRGPASTACVDAIIGDLGIAERLGKPLKEPFGPPGFMAPEWEAATPEHQVLATPALDVWAFGMTLLDLLKGPTTGPRSRDFWRTAFRGHRHEHEYVHLI